MTSIAAGVRVAALATFLFLALSCQKGLDPVGPSEASPDKPGPTGGTITLEVAGARNDNGSLLVYLFDSADTFPGEYSSAVRTTKTPIREGASSAVFATVPAGAYAISVIHDEDDNGELRTNFLGIPREGVGSSNNPAPRMGPPRWVDAMFDHAGDLSMKIELQYP